MNANASSTTVNHEVAPKFPLYWTIGFSGHRELPNEATARAAVRAEISSLKSAAVLMHAWLVAVSSVALGADLVFAEECLAAGLPWKCLLPFPQEEFRRDDFTEADWARVEQCLARAYRVETLTEGIPLNPEARNKAYTDCGHRTVEAADVMLLLWNGQPSKGSGGTADMWEYARTLNRPAWYFNPVDASTHRVGWPGADDGGWQERRLFHSRVTPLIMEATELEHVTPTKDGPVAPATVVGEGLLTLFTRLDHVAEQRQGDTKRTMQNVLRAHLLATAAAALSVTVITQNLHHRLHDLPALAVLAAIGFSALVIAKPVLAGLALHWDRNLHKFNAQKRWVEARVAAELCRSALTCWSMPTAPLRVFEEEDFPHFKRLICTLRIARETDPAAASPEHAAIEGYLTARVEDQARYFKRKHGQAVKEYQGWQRKFNLATGFVIVIGGLAGLAEAIDSCCSASGVPLPSFATTASHFLHLASPYVAFLLIMAPFYATYALAMLAILDCRRRRERYASMEVFLERQKNRITRMKSPASRAAMVQNTERMLLEELHEWHSVTREVRV